MKQVRKAVLPVAGLGTRFLPATKVVPKELLPIVDMPLIALQLDELRQAGITQLIFITGRGKYAIEDLFDTSFELENTLASQGKQELLERVLSLRRNIEVVSLRQRQALGLGHAVSLAETVVGDEPFAVLLPDELHFTEPHEPSGIQQLVRAYAQSAVSTVAVMKVPADETHKYGIVAAEERSDGRLAIRSVVEKPPAGQAPSQWALPGRYVFSPSIFNHLKRLQAGRNGEYQLTDAMTSLAQHEGLHGLELQGQRYDAGDKLGFLIATVEYALRHPEVGAKFHRYLKERLQ